jgi:hypothetical protein
MLELPHTLVGATIATKIPNPLISLPLAFFSHFLLDLLPHWNPSLYSETKKFGKPTPRSTKIVIIDTLLSLAGGFFLAYQVLPNFTQAVVIILACFLAVVVDVIEGFYFFFGVRGKFLENLIEFQHRYQGKASLIPGLVIQLAVVIITLFLARWTT